MDAGKGKAVARASPGAIRSRGERETGVGTGHPRSSAANGGPMRIEGHRGTRAAPVSKDGNRDHPTGAAGSGTEATGLIVEDAMTVAAAVAAAIKGTISGAVRRPAEGGMTGAT